MQTMQTNYTKRAAVRRTLYAGLAAMLVLSFVTFPSLRAMAGGILQTFRVQSTTFVPVDLARLQQLATLHIDPAQLFISAPSASGPNGHLESTTVSGASEAASIVGYQPQQIYTPPSSIITREFSVNGSLQMSATVNVEELRSVLSLLNIQNVTLPDSLSQAPIVADLPPSVMTVYKGDNYTLRLIEGRSPTVSMPPGVDLSELGKAGLQVLGMSADEADTMSRQIDWSSTLVVPFPSNVSAVQVVQVDNVDSLLVHGGGGSAFVGAAPGPAASAAGNELMYWQHGDHFFILDGTGAGVNDATMLAAARSVR